MKKLLISSLLLTSVAFAQSLSKSEAVKEAEDAVHQLHKMMKAQIKPLLKKEEVLSAARFCAEESYKKIQTLDRNLGENVSIKRISLKNRNPLSFPEKREEDILKAFELIESSNAYLPEYIVQIDKKGNYSLYFPTTMSSRSCKACHGLKTNMKQEVKDFLEKEYPKDKAFGYSSGQVRGAVVVKIKSSEN